MSNLPTLQRAYKNPKEAFRSLLKAIIDASPSDKETYIKPLMKFISHPTIKDIIGKSNAPEQADADATSHKSELDKIQTTLNLLTKAIEDLKKGIPSNKSPLNRPSKQQGGDTSHSRDLATQPESCGGLGTPHR